MISLIIFVIYFVLMTKFLNNFIKDKDIVYVDKFIITMWGYAMLRFVLIPTFTTAVERLL